VDAVDGDTARDDGDAGDGAADANRVRIWPIVLGVVLQSLIILLIYSLASANAPPPRLLAFDLVALPGEKVALEVRIDQDLPPLLGSADDAWSVTIDGTAPGSLPATTTTATNQPLLVALTAPEKPGIIELRVHAKSADDDVDLQRKVVLQVVPADARIVISTVRHTLWSRPIARRSEAGEPLPPRARPGASATLGRLAADHSILYLELIPRRYLPWIGDWLDENGFPKGAVLFVRDHDPRRPDTRGAALIRFLSRRIKDRWKSGAWAFGSDEEETQALATVGFRTVHIGARGGDSGNTPPVVPAQSWDAVDDIIK